MTEKYAISIIIPVYNSAAFLNRALDSLFDQYSPDYQYIFIDDASTDNSINIIIDSMQKYNIGYKNVIIERLKSNIGSASTRNRGIELAEGQYISFMDSDDWLEANAYRTMLKFASDNDYDIIWTDFYYTYKNNKVLCVQNFEGETITCVRNLLTEKMHGALWNKLYKRDLFINNNLKFPDGQDYWEDLYTNIRLFTKSKRIGYLDKAFYNYYQDNSTSLGNQSFIKKTTQIYTNAQNIIAYLNSSYNDVYTIELNYLKLASKQMYLFSTEIHRFRDWVQIFPESNKYILSYKALPLHLRIIGWAAYKHQWWLIHFYTILKKLKR